MKPLASLVLVTVFGLLLLGTPSLARERVAAAGSDAPAPTSSASGERSAGAGGPQAEAGGTKKETGQEKGRVESGTFVFAATDEATVTR